MTEVAKRRTRWPKGRVRALAWGTGGAAFIMAAAPLVAAPKPPDVAAAGHTAKRAPTRQVIERHITRKVIIVDPVVSAPVYSSSGGSSSGSYGSSSGGQISANPAPAPAPPATSTGGS